MCNKCRSYFTERYYEAMRTVDDAERNAIFKELAVIALDDVPYISFSSNFWATYWWPWVRNYYGEFEISAWGNSYLMAAAWLDQDLKAEMGY